MASARRTRCHRTGAGEAWRRCTTDRRRAWVLKKELIKIRNEGSHVEHRFTKWYERFKSKAILLVRHSGWSKQTWVFMQRFFQNCNVNKSKVYTTSGIPKGPLWLVKVFNTTGVDFVCPCQRQSKGVGNSKVVLTTCLIFISWRAPPSTKLNSCLKL